MNKKIVSFFAALALLLPIDYARAQATGIEEIYVSVSHGDDQNDGSKDRPFKTIEKAKNIVAGLEKNKPIVVNIESGRYYFDKTLTIDKTGSGTLENPVTYRAYGGEVIFSGGKELSYDDFSQISNENMIKRLSDTAKNNVLQADLKEFDVKADPAIRGISGESQPIEGAELFIDNENIRLACWPDFGYVQAGYCSDNTAYVTKEIYIKNIEDRQQIWLDDNGTMIEKHAQIEAFSDANYRTAGAKLLGVDPETGHMISGEQRDSSCAFYGGMRYYVFNIAEELDAPGEYYIDRENSVLYFYPTENFSQNSNIVISQLASELVKITEASNINFEGISFSDTRGNGIVMNKCSDISISDYGVKNIGGSGVTINNCKNVVFTNGKIYNIARVGFNFAETINNELAESGNVLKNSEIYACSRSSGATVPAIVLAGVGNRIEDCRIHDCPSAAIGMSGLKHLISDNEFYNFCEYISDWGVIYIGRSWAYYGNTIKNNYFHDITSNGINSIYLDDYMSGITVEGNAFVNCYSGISASGGRDNTVINNFFYNCQKSLVMTTHWGVSNDKYHSKYGTDNDNVYYRLINTPYLAQLKKEFSGVARILKEYDSPQYPDSHPEYPKYNTVYGNTVYSSHGIYADENVVKYGNIAIDQTKDIAIYR